LAAAAWQCRLWWGSWRLTRLGLGHGMTGHRDVPVNLLLNAARRAPGRTGRGPPVPATRATVTGRTWLRLPYRANLNPRAPPPRRADPPAPEDPGPASVSRWVTRVRVYPASEPLRLAPSHSLVYVLSRCNVCVVHNVRGGAHEVPPQSPHRLCMSERRVVPPRPATTLEECRLCILSESVPTRTRVSAELVPFQNFAEGTIFLKQIDIL
jgi:hypothetical protein